jgi:hypothetical protein
MFDGTYDAPHDEVVDAAIAARDALSEDEVIAAFVSSLTSRRLDLRSALGSFAVARHLKRHAHDPGSSGPCRTCGLRADERDIDRNVMSFERLKWGGVRRDDLVYVAFDLEQFASADLTQPARIVRCLRRCSTNSRPRRPRPAPQRRRPPCFAR